MKYLAFSLFIIFNTNLDGQIIYTNQQRPLLNIESWDWINSDNKEKELAEKHLLLEFWASWCPGGLTTIPNINRVNYPDPRVRGILNIRLNTIFSEDIAFVSVNSYDTQPVIEKLIQEHSIKSYVIRDGDKYLEDIEVNFLATTNQKVEKTLFLSETIKAFATALNASIDTTLIQQNVQMLKVDSNDLEPFLSANQESSRSSEEQDDQLIFQNLTLKEFSRYIGQITNERILLDEDDQQKYNFTIH